jgi:hypothetical protein
LAGADAAGAAAIEAIAKVDRTAAMIVFIVVSPIV